RISFVFQQFHLLQAITAIDNVATGLLYTGASVEERRARAAAALEDVGLGHRLRNRPGELSGVEQCRVASSRALVRYPAALCACEPTGALDSATGEEIVALITRIAHAGTAVVMITHDESLARQFTHRIRLKDGHIIERQAE